MRQKKKNLLRKIINIMISLFLLFSLLQISFAQSAYEETTTFLKEDINWQFWKDPTYSYDFLLLPWYFVSDKDVKVCSDIANLESPRVAVQDGTATLFTPDTRVTVSANAKVSMPEEGENLYEITWFLSFLPQATETTISCKVFLVDVDGQPFEVSGPSNQPCVAKYNRPASGYYAFQDSRHFIGLLFDYGFDVFTTDVVIASLAGDSGDSDTADNG
ncbi:hypothetical protein ACFL0W_04800 [Nanoarchaeota archaeon]